MKKIIVLFIAALFLPLIYAEAPENYPLLIEDCGNYCQIKLPTHETPYLYNEGYPLLPYYTETYVFPMNTKINEVQVNIQGYRQIGLSKKILPSPQAKPIHEANITSEYKEASIYYEDIFYPYNWSTHTVGMGIIKGQRQIFLTIHLFPIRYNAVRNEIRYTSDFHIMIDHEPLEKTISVDDTYDLLIIAPLQWTGILENLRLEKEKNSVATKIVSLNEIYTERYFPMNPQDDNEKIKYFIKDAIEQWGIKSVMLVGDADMMPVRYVATSIGNVPCDLYFADIYNANGTFSSWDADGDGEFGERRDDKIDKFPDVTIGRLPASNEQELETLLQKIMEYEAPPMKALMVGTELFWDTENREGEYLKEEISNEINIETTKLYETQEYPHDKIPTAETISEAINEGTFFVNFAAHGNPHGMGWEAGSFGSYDAQSLTNTYLPIVFAMSCSTNQFDDTDCLGEEFLLAPEGGAIAYAGSSRVAYVYLGKGIKSGLSGYLDKAFFKAYYDGGSTVGELFSNAKIDYLLNHPFYNDIDWLTLVEFNLLGDPSIPLPSMPLTSKVYTGKTHSNQNIHLWAETTEDETLDLYYRKKVFHGGRWKFYGSVNSPPYEWDFLPEEEGNYEFYTILKKGNYSENRPGIPDASCYFDFTPPEIEINKPQPGGIYLLNRKIATSNLIDFAIVLGKIGIEVNGDLYRAELYYDDELIASDEDEPFQWTDNRLPVGIHSLKVVGYDIAGNSASTECEILSLNVFSG